MSKERLENFTDRREAIALFNALRGRDPAKPWPLLPILAFIAPGGSGKSTLIEYLRDKVCYLSYELAALPFAHLDFTRPDTPKDLLSILVNLRDQLQQHDDGQGKHLAFPRFDIGALIAQSALANTDITSFTPTTIRRKLSTGKQVFESLNALGNTLGYTVPYIAPLIAGLNLAGQIKSVKDLLNYLEDNTGWKWYQKEHGAETRLGPKATMEDVLRRLQVLSIPGKPERDVLVNELLPAAFIADLVDALVDADPPRAWTKTANVVIFLDGFEAIQRSASTTATRLLQVLTTEQRKHGKTDPLLLVIGSRDYLPGLPDSKQRTLFARTTVKDERSVLQHIQELYARWQQLPVNRLGLKDLYLTYWLPDFGQEDTHNYLLRFGERGQTGAFAQNDVLVKTIDRVTHGHPLYLALAAEAVLEANQRGKVLTSDDFELADVSAEVDPEHEAEQVRDYLLNLFLRQLSESERRELIFCAVPRFLDAVLIRAILQLPNDIEAGERWKRSRRLSFMSAIDDRRIVFHPLVRTLLLRQLPPNLEPESDYYRTHDRLREHFHKIASLQRSSIPSGMEDWQFQIEEAYHALALGDPEPAITLALTIQPNYLHAWKQLLEAVAQAPTSLIPSKTEQCAYDSLALAEKHHNVKDGIVALILYLWLLTTTHGDNHKAAFTQANLGRAYSQLLTGDRAANLEQAIKCFEEALRVWTSETMPLEYAATQNNLGRAYRDLPTGDRTTNLERAIACFQEALRFRTPESTPFEYASTQNNLGTAYSQLPTGDRTANLKRAIACFQQALRFRTPGAAPLDYASTQNNLGTAYSQLPTGNRTANLMQAIACFQEALHFWTPETAPFDYASTQNNLGTAYSQLPTGDRTANLAQAIRCFQKALRFWTPEAAPFEYASTQNNLGIVYSQLPTGDRAANLARALMCFREALRFYTPEAAPFEYASTQNNLGIAYRDLPTGDRSANLTQAITCFQEALRFRTPEAAPFDYARTQTNLGFAYSQLPTGNRTTNLAQAIGCFQQALRFYTPEAAPFEYASTQNNLGIAYRDLPTGDRSANLTQAIMCFQQALRFRTPEAAPFDYASTQTNLGFAYSQLPTGDRAANLAQAIECFQEALRFWTPESAPYECQRSTRNLANLYFAQGAWDAALRAYSVAMDVGEQLYRVGLSTESKAAEVSESTALYPYAAFAAVRCGKTAEALLILERGKTRLLTEALRLRVGRPPQVPDEIWNMFEQAGTAVRAEQAEKALMVAEVRDPVQAYEAHVQTARAANAALDAVIAQVRTYVPHFLEAIDLSIIEAQLLDEQTALIAFCITEQGSMGFVVSQHDQEKIQVVEVPAFTQIDLHRLLVELDADGRPAGGWLGAYIRYLSDRNAAAFEAWQRTITHVLAELGERLLIPLLSALSADIERIILLPSAELFLFPLHAVPLSGIGPKLVCDRYQVSYAPSIEVLSNVRTKAAQRGIPKLYAVINPGDDPRLFFTQAEGAALAQLFPQSHRIIDTGSGGTKQHVIDGMQGRTYVHFSCHGGYRWDDPPASGLELADGRLTLAELQRGVIDLSTARLVTLSADETGITDVLRGNAEEYVGIPAGFLLAGVPCVVSSLWAVPDLSTALLMERFYRNHLVDTMDFAAALQEAQEWVRELSIGEVAAYAAECYRQSTQKEEEKKELFRYTRYYRYLAEQNPTLRPFAHPYYWAAFTVNGW